MITQYPRGIDQVSIADGPQLDAFSRLRVSEAVTVFDSQQEYGLDTLRIWDCAANGTLSTGSSNGSAVNGSNAVGPRNLNTRMTPITVSTTNGHYSILQSRQYARYIPGKSHLILMTGVFAPASGFSASFVLRTSTSGSVSDGNAVAQASWNIDTFGAGTKNPSGVTLDFTKTQIMFIQAQWLGVGRVIIGFDVNGVLYPAHEFLNANSLTVPYSQSFNLPVRVEARNTSATTTVSRFGYFDSANGVFLELSKTAGSPPGGTVNFVCCSVQSEGGVEPRGFPNSAPVGINTIAVTTRRPVLSIRPKATYNSVTNRAHIEDIEAILRATTNDALYELVIGGTLTKTASVPTWTSVSNNSVAEYCTDADGISGGESITKGFVPSGSGVVSGSSTERADIRNPLTISQIDALTATQINISLVCTAFTGTSNVTSLLNWHEQVT